jgi:hypothetical protein
MNLRIYHIIAGVFAWITILHLLKIRVPIVSKYLTWLTSSPAKSVAFGLFAGKLIGNFYSNSQAVADPVLRIWQTVIQTYETLIFKAAK